MSTRPTVLLSSGAALVVVLLGGCDVASSGTMEAPSQVPTDRPPRWFDEDDVPEASISFEDGLALAATDVSFRNRLDNVYDWETVGEPTETRTELVNTGNGCHVLDEESPYTGIETDDRGASTDVVKTLLADTEPAAGPDRSIWGPDEGLG